MTIQQLVRRDLKAAVRAMFAGFVETHAIRGTGAKKQRRRKCLSCGGLTHPAAMTSAGECQGCADAWRNLTVADMKNSGKAYSDLAEEMDQTAPEK